MLSRDTHICKLRTFLFHFFLVAAYNGWYHVTLFAIFFFFFYTPRINSQTIRSRKIVVSSHSLLKARWPSRNISSSSAHTDDFEFAESLARLRPGGQSISHVRLRSRSLVFFFFFFYSFIYLLIKSRVHSLIRSYTQLARKLLAPSCRTEHRSSVTGVRQPTEQTLLIVTLATRFRKNKNHLTMRFLFCCIILFNPHETCTRKPG